MTTKEAMKYSMGMSRDIIHQYISDLSDDELLIRPVPGMNHIAWQLGHLISSERQMISAIGHTMPELPAGFEKAHSRETVGSDDRAGFASRERYTDLMRQMREATLTALDATPESEFDKPGPEGMRAYAPTVGSVFAMIANHELMHCGQFVPVRRMCGKPVTI